MTNKKQINSDSTQRDAPHHEHHEGCNHDHEHQHHHEHHEGCNHDHEHGHHHHHKKIGRNDPCICGSGKKYKKCCLGS